MRLALTTLILAAGAATLAYAQDPAAQPAPAAAQPAPADATTAPAAPPATAPATPATPGALPAAPAPEPAPPPPTLPTAGPGAEAISLLEKVCVPIVRGQKLDVIAKAQGFKKNRRDETWAKPLGADKAVTAIVQPQFSNKTVCSVELRYPVGSDVEVAKALNVWAFVHTPPLDPTANYTQPQDPDGLRRVRRSWEHLTQNQSIGLNFSTVRKPDDTPLNAKYDVGTMQYQERPLS